MKKIDPLGDSLCVIQLAFVNRIAEVKYRCGLVVAVFLCVKTGRYRIILIEAKKSYLTKDIK